VQSLGLESPDLVDAIPRYKMWKVARTKSDGQMTSQSTQIISQKNSKYKTYLTIIVHMFLLLIKLSFVVQDELIE